MIIKESIYTIQLNYILKSFHTQTENFLLECQANNSMWLTGIDNNERLKTQTWYSNKACINMLTVVPAIFRKFAKIRQVNFLYESLAVNVLI